MVILYYPRNTPRGQGRVPLSLLALGAVLEGRFPYLIVDGNVDPRPLNSLTRIIESHRDAILCVSVMPGTQMLNAIHDTRTIKSRFPSVTTIWGGYFPSMHTESVLNSSYVDFVIRAQGERSLLSFLENRSDAVKIATIPNLSFREGNTFHHNGDYPVFDPDSRPLMPYHAVDMERYAIPTFIGKRTFCHESSVGCPHKCNFCGVVDLFHSRWKAESVDRTIEVIRHLKRKYGMDGIEFHDSELFVSEKRMDDLCHTMVDERIQWWAEGRIDTLLNYSKETWNTMQRSGLRMIFLGAESGFDETLRLMDKSGVTREKTKAIAALCREFGIQSEFSFVMGSNPTHTREDIDATIDLMYELEQINPRSQMHPFVYTPVPFGAIYDAATRGGLTYPTHLDHWSSREWTQYTLRRNPHTPWLTRGLYNKIINFRAVHQAYFPKTNDRVMPAWKQRVLRVLSGWRYKYRFFRGAYEIRFLLRLLGNPSPGREGF